MSTINTPPLLAPRVSPTPHSGRSWHWYYMPAWLRQCASGALWLMTCLLWMALAAPGVWAAAPSTAPGAIASQLSVGAQHSCAVVASGAVQCWGYNSSGQTNVPAALQSGGAVSVAAGYFHTCAVTTGGAVQCWGYNSSGQTNVPAALQGGGVVSVAAGYAHTCALTTGGAVHCWGDNGDGRISVPATLQGGGAVSVAAGNSHTCAVTTGGAVQCWGYNGFGQTGVPAALQGGGVVSVAAGNSHTCAVTTGGAVQCWGDNSNGKTNVPAALQGGGAVSVAAGNSHTCAVTTGGAVQCWGFNGSGQTNVPAALQSGGAVSVAAGYFHTCAVTTGGAVQCWGRNTEGQISVLAALQGGGAVSVAAGGGHTCAVTTGGAVQCWGYNSSGQTNVPAALQGGGAVFVAAGDWHSCALTTGGAVQCWGYNGQGRTSVPAALQGGGALSVTAGGLHTCAVTTGGAVQCWGNSVYGQTSVPAALQGGGVVSVAAGYMHTCAVTTGGAVQCWGYNGFGQTGVPAALQGGGAVSVAAGNSHTCAVTTGGAVQCWGNNGDGQTSVPAALQGGGAVSVAAGGSHTCAVTTDDAVQCWGFNGFAQAPALRASPRQSITFTPVASPRAGASSSLTASASSGLAVTFDTWTPDVCRVAGSTVTLLPGKVGHLCGVRASQSGGTDASNLRYVAAPVRSQVLVVQAGLPSTPTGLQAIPADRAVSLAWAAASDNGSPITGYTVTGVPGSGGSSSVSCNTTGAFTCTVPNLTNGTAYSFTVTATNGVGTGPASSPPVSATPRGAQTITFADPGAQNFGTAPKLTASADSGLTVAFTSASPAVCAVTSVGTLTFLSIGNCTIHADQAGNTAFDAAPRVSRTFSVNAVAPGAPTIGTATPGNGQATVTFTPPAASGGSAITVYTVASTPGGLTATGGASPITVPGLVNGTAYTFIVRATNGVGMGAPSAVSNAVTPIASQTITFANPGAQTFGTAPTLTASADSGLAIAFTSASPAVCTVAPGGLLTFLAAGPCTINADQAGNSAFNAAPQVSRTFAVLAQLSVSGSVPGMTGTATATLSGGGAGCTLASGTGFADPGSTPGGYTMPHGGFAFVASGCTNGSSVTLTLTYPQALPAGVQFWKFGPATPGATTSTWFAWTGATLSPDNRTVSYTVADNGIGDADAAAGTIRDPFAPVLAIAAAGVTSIPTLGEWGLMLTSLLAAGLGMLALRRRP